MRKAFFFKYFAFLSIFMIVFARTPDMSSFIQLNDYYYAIPPYLEKLYKPNILVVLQDDARMHWRAYYNTVNNNYNDSKIYYGLFNPYICYKWNDNKKAWETTSETSCNVENVHIDKYPIIKERVKTCKISDKSYKCALTYKALQTKANYNGVSISLSSSIRIPYIKFKNKKGEFLVYSLNEGNECVLKAINLQTKQEENIGECKENNLMFDNEPETPFDVYYVPIFRKNVAYKGNFLNWFYTTRKDLIRLVFTGGSPLGCPKTEGDPNNFNYANPYYCDIRYINNNEIIIQGQSIENWELYWEVHPHLTDIVNNKYPIYFYSFPGVTVLKRKTEILSQGLLYLISSIKENPRFGLVIYDTANPVIHPAKVYIGGYLSNGKKDNKVYENIITTLNTHRDLFYRDASYNSNSYFHYADIYDAGNSLAPALWEVYRYLKQQNPMYGGFLPESYDNRAFRNPNYQKKMLGSDCEDSLKKEDFCFIKKNINYVILITDGLWNIGSNNYGELIKSCSIDDGFENFSSDPIVPIYWMYKKENLIEKFFIINFYPYGPEGENAAKLMAIYGGFNKLKYTWPQGFSGYPMETCSLINYNSAFVNCKGSLCVNNNTILKNSCNNDWDKNCDGIPDNFYSAKDYSTLKLALTKIFLSILQNFGSGSSLGIPTSKKKAGGTLQVLHNILLQPTLYASRTFSNTISWVSSIYTWWLFNNGKNLNIRADTNQNKILDVLEDYILEWDYDWLKEKVYIKAYNSTLNGIKDSLQKLYYDFLKAHPIIDLGKRLEDTIYRERKIYTAINGALIKIDENFSSFLEKLYKENQITFFVSFNCLTNICKWIWDCSFDVNCVLDKYLLCVKNNYLYNKLVDWIRGKDIYGFRERTTNKSLAINEENEENVWKLGDITYSSPVIVDYKDYKVLYISSNDGMLHAFLVGSLKNTKDSLHPLKLVDNNTSNSTDNIGKELWAFIPKDILPYYGIISNPYYRHIYSLDLTPFVVNYKGRKILIGGFRLGGAVADNAKDAIHPPEYACPNTLWNLFKEFLNNCGICNLPIISGICQKSNIDYSNCYGLSGYYALDITNPFKPKFLWYFTHKNLGFSFSGPGIIRKRDKAYVVFASGPINYKAVYERGDNVFLKIFILDLISGNLLREINTGLKNAFAGRIFKEGFDYNKDGNTDVLIFGYTQIQDFDSKNQQENANGGLIILNTVSSNPNDWQITIPSLSTPPITSKVIVDFCFNKPFIFFGTGKWFWRTENPIGAWGGKNLLFGKPLICSSTGCRIKEGNGQDQTNEQPSNVCSKNYWESNQGWYIELPQASEVSNNISYNFKNKIGCFIFSNERVITDPTFIKEKNVVIFATTTPCIDMNSNYPALSRFWVLNCANGLSLTSNCKNFQIRTDKLKGSLLFQTSTGAINKISLQEIVNKKSRVSDWFIGSMPEQMIPYVEVEKKESRKGEILLWLEY